MPAFVPDASVTLPWCFEDERTLYTEALLNRLIAAEEVVVPSHWPAEIFNSLLQAKKRGLRGRRQDPGLFTGLEFVSHSHRSRTKSRILAAGALYGGDAPAHGVRCGVSRTGTAHRGAARYARRGFAKSRLRRKSSAAGGNIRISAELAVLPAALRIGPAERALAQFVPRNWPAR